MLAIQMQQLNVSSLEELEEKVGPENKQTLVDGL
jgi:hypothetical protein